LLRCGLLAASGLPAIAAAYGDRRCTVSQPNLNGRIGHPGRYCPPQCPGYVMLSERLRTVHNPHLQAIILRFKP
jgi:hypothetical protein